MRAIIGNLLFIAAMFLIIARFLSVWSGTPFPIDLVTSDSMTPTLMEGDVVAWTPTRIDDIQKGDIVVFRSYVSWPDEKIVVHRVSNITTSRSGQLLLETKGDKNEWTDQAGPHIPEPYIRDDHLMGKVLSIGQIPLKVPFVGIFGLWINQGLESISQPTSSKGSLSYAGIFTPLVISAVILVILVFILPEKAKTFKEKIHYFIFGSKPLNLKRTFFTFLIAYIVFFSFIHAFAFDQQSAAVGINADSTRDVAIDFGRIKTGSESFPRNLPVINPSAMPVKGIIFGKGDIGNYISRQTFNLSQGESNVTKLHASATAGSINGSFTGDIMVYSSPFWLMFPDAFIHSLIDWNPEATIFILDFIAAVVLTAFTMLLLISITFIGTKTVNWLIDNSWRHSSHLIIKKDVIKRLKTTKEKAKKALGSSMGWILNIEYGGKEEIDPKYSKYIKPVIASIIIFPLLFLIIDPVTAMVISVIIGGLFAYSISCKVRKKIVLTSLIIMVIAIIHMMIQSNFVILDKYTDALEILSLSVGVIGVYLLLLSLLLIPLAAISWALTRFIRNLKERKDPLLSLEGHCDL